MKAVSYAAIVVGLALGAHAFMGVHDVRDALQVSHYGAKSFAGSALSAFPMLPTSLVDPLHDGTEGMSFPIVIAIEILVSFALLLLGGFGAFFRLSRISRREELSSQRYDATMSSGVDFHLFNHRGRGLGRAQTAGGR